ncbi:MAG: hypothetical protein JNJ45_09080 [Chthonomonas sp.]|nr:hypothetical protein [Chthonomonas sp.]
MAVSDFRNSLGASRAISAPDPAQQGAFEQPTIVSSEQEEHLAQELATELGEKGFNTRQAAEAVGYWRAYADQTRAWSSSVAALRAAEEVGDGFRARATAFMAACRRQNVRFRTPRVLNDRAIEDVLLRATKKHDKTTMKVAGGMFGLVVAIMLKAYLLLPVANTFLGKLLGPGNTITKGTFSFALACVIAYSITYAMRFLMQLVVHMNAGDAIKPTRNLGELLTTRANKAIVFAVGFMFIMVIYSFLRYDVGTAEADGGAFSAFGLNFLFLIIVIVYELAVAYRTAYFQINGKPEIADDLIEKFNVAMERWHDEEDLGKLRTLVLLNQQRWADFMRQLDAGMFEGKKSVENRANALNRMRGTKTNVVSVFGPKK